MSSGTLGVHTIKHQCRFKHDGPAQNLGVYNQRTTSHVLKLSKKDFNFTYY